MIERLNIAICEDTAKDVEKLTEIIEHCGQEVEYTVYNSGEALLEEYIPQRFDLLLIDIFMGGMTGVETVAKIRKVDPDIPIAFVTSSLDYTLEGYRLSVLKYIEKPYEPKEIQDMLMLAKLKKQSRPCLTVCQKRSEIRIPFSRILYVEQRNHQLTIYINDGTSVSVYEKLSNILPEMENQGFFSGHKSYAVNLNYVKKIDNEMRCFVLPSEIYVPIRRESMSKAKQQYNEFLFARTRSISR